MVPGSRRARAAAAALRRPPADRRQHRGVLRRPGAGDVRQVRRWLVLVGAPAGLSARQVRRLVRLLRATQRIGMR